MEYVEVNAYNNYVEANIVLGRLQEEDIDCWLKDENTSTIMPIWNQAIGGIRLMVAESDAKNAIELLSEFRGEQKNKLQCPWCGSHDIEFVSTPRKPGNWFSFLLGLLFFSFAPPVEQVYHCFNCKKEFKEAKEIQPATD